MNLKHNVYKYLKLGLDIHVPCLQYILHFPVLSAVKWRTRDLPGKSLDLTGGVSVVVDGDATRVLIDGAVQGSNSNSQYKLENVSIKR